MEASLSAVPARQAGWWRELRLLLGLGLLSRLWLYGQAGLINAVFAMGRSSETLLCSWDCGWYHDLVVAGYHREPIGMDAVADSDGKANWAFFPLFPLASRLLMGLTGLGFNAAAQGLNNLCFLAALPLLYAYARRWLERDDALFVVALLAFSPYSLYFSAPYTEALYLLAMLGCLLAAREGHWLVAGLCGAALSATRNLGVFVSLSMAVLALQQFGWRRLLRFEPGTERCWLGLVLSALGLFAYMAYLHQLVGDALAFKHVQVAWGGEFMNPFERIYLGLLTPEPYERYCALVLALGLAAALFLWRRGLRPEALVLLLGCLIPATVRLTSAPRYVLTLFPIYLAAGLWLRGQPRAQVAVLVLSASLTGFLLAAWLSQKVVAV